MNIGIIIYSRTGNTLAAAEEIGRALDGAGHAVNIERIETDGEPSGPGEDVKFNVFPEVTQYDALIFGAPVHAFSLAPVMAAYLDALPSLKDKQVACFVTKRLPFAWTGGNRATATMKRICAEKGASVRAAEIVFCSRSGREESIRRCAERLGSLFTD